MFMMSISIEEMEQVFMQEFDCNRQKANIVANLLKDFELKKEGYAI